MDEITQQILINLVTGYVTKVSLINFFKKPFQKKPKLENDLKTAKTPADFEKVFQEAIGIIDALSGSGSIEVDSDILEAVRGIRFDHQNGKVEIVGSTLSAPLLQTGGIGEGQTEIVNSTLKSKGTKISMCGNGKIMIKGDAQIKQS